MVDGEIDDRSYTREQLEQAPDTRPLVPVPLEFRGSGSEYFRIWIVNLALTILTLGIYSAWAKVRRLRYFHGSTVLAGSAFGYHGEPLKILKGRAIAAVLVVAYALAGQVSPIAGAAVAVLLAAAVPWLVVKSRLFTMRMTSWRGLRFDFRQDFAGAYSTILGLGVLTVVTLGLLFPYWTRERLRFVVSRTRFAGESFDCDPRTGRFYKTAIVAGLALVGGVTVLSMAVGALVGGLALLAGAGAEAGEGMDSAIGIVFVVGFALAFYALVFPFVYGYYQSRNLNEVLGRTTVGPVRLASALQARRLAWIYLSNVALIVVTLGLYIPWAAIRLARYRVETLSVSVQGSIDEFVASAGARDANATGEEISDLFDVDFGL